MLKQGKLSGLRNCKIKPRGVAIASWMDLYEKFIFLFQEIKLILCCLFNLFFYSRMAGKQNYINIFYPRHKSRLA